MSSLARALWRRPLPTPSSSWPTSHSPILPRPLNTPRRPRHQRFQSTDPSPKSKTKSKSQPEPSPPNPPNPPNNTTNTDPPPSPLLTRLDRSRFLPPSLRPHLSRLRSAPLSHVTAFLVLHELTAVLPVLGLAWAFHAADWAPTGWVLGPWAASAEEGLRRYAGWFRRKGWFGFEKKGGGDWEGEMVLEGELHEEVLRERERERERERGGGRRWTMTPWRKRRGHEDGDDAGGPDEKAKTGEKISAAWKKARTVVNLENTEKGYKIGIQIAAAYAITKMLLVPRIALSLWMTPWLARGFVSARQAIWRRKSN